VSTKGEIDFAQTRIRSHVKKEK